MNFQNCVLAVFSPTGGTEKIAQAVAQGMDLPVRVVDLCRETAVQTVAANELLVAALPVFGGRLPALARQRLEQLHGGSGPAVALAVYGNREYEDALVELRDVLRDSGFVMAAAGAFVAEHSIDRSVAAGRPDAQDLQTAKEFGARAAEKIRDAEALTEVEVPGSADYTTKKTDTGPVPQTTDDCIGCGLCAAACPAAAIPPEHPNTTTAACIGCMRCVALCPHKARNTPAPILQMVSAFLKTRASAPKQPEVFL